MGAVARPEPRDELGVRGAAARAREVGRARGVVEPEAAQRSWPRCFCAHATCERVLAGLASLHELPGHADPAPNGWESWGLGKLIGHVRRQGWIEPDVLDDVAALSERRKPFGHWRRPLAAGTPGRRMADSVTAGNDEPDELTMRLLAGDAHAAVTTALRVYFGTTLAGLSPQAPPVGTEARPRSRGVVADFLSSRVRA